GRTAWPSSRWNRKTVERKAPTRPSIHTKCPSRVLPASRRCPVPRTGDLSPVVAGQFQGRASLGAPGRTHSGPLSLSVRPFRRPSLEGQSRELQKRRVEVELTGPHAGDLPGGDKRGEFGAVLFVVHIEDEPLAVLADYIHFPLGMLLTQ